MNNIRLPKHIDNEMDFHKYQNKYNCTYTIDDFINDYRVSERAAKEFLKDVDHISISQSLYVEFNKKYEGSFLKRKKFFNRLEVFKELVKEGIINFNLNYMGCRLNESGRYEPVNNEVTSEKIPVSHVYNHYIFFMDILETSGSISEMGSLFNEKTPTHKRKNNRAVKKMEGIEICVGKKIKRYHPLLPEIIFMDAIVAHNIATEIIKEKMIGLVCLLNEK